MPETTKKIRRTSGDRKASIDAAAESEADFRTLVEELPEAILVHSQDRIAFLNPFCMRLLGAKTPGQLLGKNIFEIIHPASHPTIRRQIQDCYRTQKTNPPMETTLVSLDGSSIPIEATAIFITWRGSPAIELLIRDMRERKRAQLTIEEWQKRLSLAERAGLRIGLWDWDLNNNTVIWSDESYRQFGFTRETFSGRVEDAAARIHPEDRPRVDEAIQRVVTGGTEYAAQYRVVRPDQTTCWIDAHGVIVREGLTRMLGIGIDITPQKRTEQSLQEAKIELARVSRIVTVGELTASIAHEINQPITAIVTNGSACLRWLALQPPNLDQAREAAAAAIRDANRAGEVIRGMRELLLNRVSPDLALVDLNEAIREVMALSGSELMIAGVAAQAELSSPLPLVIGNQIQLQQVILNLFTNAIDAMSNITDERKLVIRSTKSRTNVLIEVEDTGTGIDPQQADHIFEPFFTNKPQSLGIGLSVSRSIVEAHGGRLWATPGKSRGSILHFTLPIADSSGG